MKSINDGIIRSEGTRSWPRRQEAPHVKRKAESAGKRGLDFKNLKFISPFHFYRRLNLVFTSHFTLYGLRFMESTRGYRLL
jgi:hypothetical protein